MRITRRYIQSTSDLLRIAELIYAYPTSRPHVIDQPYRLTSYSVERPQNVILLERPELEEARLALLARYGLKRETWADSVFLRKLLEEPISPPALPEGFSIRHLHGEEEGVHPDFRRLGLGQALLYESFGRLHPRGATTVEVETRASNTAARRLYESVGFQVAIDWAGYGRLFYPAG